MKKPSAGFTVIEFLLVVALLAVCGGIAYWVYTRNDKPNGAETAQSSIDRGVKLTDAVYLDPPENWSYTKSPDDCLMMPADAPVQGTCKMGVVLRPTGPKLPSAVSTNQEEYFNVNLSVYANPNHRDPQDWFEVDALSGGYQQGYTESHAKINGYSAYYLREVFLCADGPNSKPEDENDPARACVIVNYVLETSKTVVLVRAAVHMPSGGNQSVDAEDFTRFEPDIAEIARAVSIEDSGVIKNTQP